MKRNLFFKAATLAAAMAAVLALGSCSDGDDGGGSTPATTTNGGSSGGTTTTNYAFKGKTYAGEADDGTEYGVSFASSGNGATIFTNDNTPSHTHNEENGDYSVSGTTVTVRYGAHSVVLQYNSASDTFTCQLGDSASSIVTLVKVWP